MRISYLRTVVCGVSFLSLTATAAFSQEAPIAAQDPVIEALEERALPSDMDPMSAGIVRELDGAAILRDRTSVNLHIKLLEDQRRHQQALVELIGIMGVDGFKAEYPDLYEKYKNSPGVLSAEIKMHELKHELEAAKAGPEDLNEPAPLTARSDGSEFFKLPEQQSIAVDGIPPAIQPPAEIVVAAPVEPPPPADTPISLREVYGVSENLYAIIMHGEEKIRVSAGDELPGDTKIVSIGDGHIDILRRGKPIKLHIRG